MVDWSKSIEAVHQRGDIVPVSVDPEATAPIPGHYVTTPVLLGGYNLWQTDGRNHSSDEWRIRNVEPVQPTHSPDIIARMEALVRKIAEAYRSDGDLREYAVEGDEARAIVRELDGPNTDEEWASQILPRDFLPPTYEIAHRCIVEAIAKGRSLEAAERGK